MVVLQERGGNNTEFTCKDRIWGGERVLVGQTNTKKDREREREIQR